MSTAKNGEIRIGVYVCHCGSNIAGVIPVKELAEFAGQIPHVVLARDYKYMCSDPGQELVKTDIRDHQLNRIVVAACSPLLHEKTFRKAAQDAGLNPYLVQMCNIREHVTWVTHDSVLAFIKAKSHIAAAIRRVAYHYKLDSKSVPILDRALVVGGGIAGIQSALTLADAGKDVILVEREPTIGGHMAMFDKTFPTLDCAACILTPKMTAVKDHPHINLLSYSEVESVEGSVGNFQVTVKRKPRYILEDLCVGCMQCIEECVYKVGKIPNEFDQGMGMRKPVYLPFPQAVPPIPVIDPESCIEFKTGKCKKTCVEACGERNAIDFKQKEKVEKFNVGAIVVSTGFKPFDPTPMTYYGYGRYDNVFTSIEIERLLNAAGPTFGKITLKDGAVPHAVGIVHCIGSRDENYHPYCSRVCCMYSLKLAHLVREKTGADIYNFYIDMRTPGKGFEEFYNRVQKEGVNFIRGKVGDVGQITENGRPRLLVRVDDTLLARVQRIPVDMIILSVALEPQADAETVRRMFGISCSKEGFFLEKHPKLAPVNTASDGVFLAGACQGPKDIPDTVAQGDAAAGKALSLICAGELEIEPNIAFINEDVCCRCQTCVAMCPYEAVRYLKEEQKVILDEALCKGCGTCVAACPSGAAQQHLFTDEQIFEEIEGVLSYV